MTPPSASSPVFPDHFQATARQLRGALTELLTELRVDPNHPQTLARRFGLNKNLAWKLSRIVTAPELHEIVPVLPGQGGLRLALDAFAAKGARPEALAAVRVAAADFELMTRIHAGDRAGLELLLTSMAPERLDRDRLERSRKLAFQGNSATLGLQVGTTFSATFAHPSPTEGRVDFASLRGLLDFRRLRPSGSWPLVSLRSYGMRPEIEPLEPTSPGGAPLVADFCSQEHPAVQAVTQGDETIFELGEGPIGNTASLSLLFGWTVTAAAPIHGDGPGEMGEYLFRLDLPAERAQFDVFIHRDLPFPPPQAFLYNLMPGRVLYPLCQHERYHLPLGADVQDLGLAPVVTTPHVPRYREMVERVCERMGRGVEEYRGWRVTLAYPPIPGFLVLAHGLAE